MHPHVTVVSLGPGSPDQLTLGACDALRSGRQIVLRTARHGAAAWLQTQEIAFTSLDHLYETAADYSSLNHQAAAEIWLRAASAPVVYGVAEPWSDATVAALYAHRPERGVIQTIPGGSAMDSLLAGLPVSVTERGIRLITANALSAAHYDPGVCWVITELDHAILAGKAKLWLMDLYPDELQVHFFPPSEKAQRQPLPIPLYTLDQQRKYDHTCAVVVPPVHYLDRQKFSFSDLTEIVQDLRGETGDPWLKKQTHQSMRFQFMEEAYEVIDAVDDGDTAHLSEELGDVLLHIVLQSHIGETHGEFTILDVIRNICAKMIHRHPEVFLRGKVAPEDMPSWEDLKKEEKHYTTVGETLLDIPPTLPALLKAAKIQYKAGAAGFDWENARDAFPKILEEAQEVQRELESGGDPAEELGDLLFSCVNVIRLCGLDPELVLANAAKKFTRRFISMENLVLSEKKTLKSLTLREMDVYWSRIKVAEG